jgi:glycosyltransferase involved in cell wall biosynthesis
MAEDGNHLSLENDRCNTTWLADCRLEIGILLRGAMGPPGRPSVVRADPNPSALRRALEQLAASPSQQERLAKSAREAAANDFNPEHIEAQFVGALRRAIYSRGVLNV